MLSENTNKITWVAVATGLVLIVGGGALTLYPDAFNGVSNVVKSQMGINVEKSQADTAIDNLNAAFSDGARTVATSGYLDSPITSGGMRRYATIATSEYSSSQQSSLASAVSGDSRDATTAFVENPDSGGIVWVFDGTQPFKDAEWSESAGRVLLDTSKISDSKYYNVGVLVSYNDVDSKQTNAGYLVHSRIVNIKATGAQLKAWSALSIKENDGFDYSGVTNAISNQRANDSLESLLSPGNLSSDTSTWRSVDKAYIINQMSADLGGSSTTDILSKVLPALIDSSK